VSTQAALQDIQTAYQAENPAVTIRYNFGASGALAQQISQGAPVDVFISASPQWMTALQDKGLIDGQPQPMLQNELVLVVPASPSSPVTQFGDLVTDGISKIAIGEPESVPAGRYAKETLDTMGLWEAIAPKLVFGKSVRQVLAYVETGNVDAGMVYATDVLASDRVTAIATAPTEAHSPIDYPVALVQNQPADGETTSRTRESARAFVAFLSSQTAREIFDAYGFSTHDLDAQGSGGHQ